MSACDDEPARPLLKMAKSVQLVPVVKVAGNSPRPVVPPAAPTVPLGPRVSLQSFFRRFFFFVVASGPSGVDPDTRAAPAGSPEGGRMAFMSPKGSPRRAA